MTPIRVLDVGLDQGFPTWGTCTLKGTFSYLKGTHLSLAIEGKNVSTYYLFPNIYTCISEYYFQKSLHANCSITVNHRSVASESITIYFTGKLVSCIETHLQSCRNAVIKTF